MAFTPLSTITPESIQDWSIQMFIPGPLNTNDPQSATIEFQVMHNDGKIKLTMADLLARLADDAEGLVHLANLNSLKTYIVARANSELLP